MSKSTRTSDNAGHSFSDATIATRVRAEPGETEIQKIAGKFSLSGPWLTWSETLRVINAYRAWLLADEPPLTDEQRSDRSAP